MSLLFSDVNECREREEICGGGVCTNTDGAYSCHCTDGLRPSSDNKQCLGKKSLLFTFGTTLAGLEKI